ncbi:MAG: Maf family protein [Pseudobdellovibrionaceae bacterium]
MIILASTSVYRQELLSRLPWSFKAVAPQLDEEAAKEKFYAEILPLIHPQSNNQPSNNFVPQKLAEYLAQQKARSLWVNEAKSIIIGSDQVVAFQGQILGKSGSKEKSIEMLQSMQGQAHEIITAVCIKTLQAEITFCVSAQMTLRSLSQAQIVDYVNKDNPTDCAGSYKIEKSGVCLFESVQCEDWTAIQGLPLIRLHAELSRLLNPASRS